MPLLRKIKAGTATRIGIWKISESSGGLRDQVKLDPEEEKIFSSFGSDTRRKQWLACRLILSDLMGEPVSVCYDEHGKPRPVKRDEFISLTHSGDMAAAILSRDFAVGIDIEKIKDRIEKVRERFLLPEELEWAAGTDRIEKLYILWGAKESLYKLAGNPGMDFRADLFIEPFDYLCNKKGTCVARMKIAGSVKKVRIAYEKMDDHMLVYAVAAGDQF